MEDKQGLKQTAWILRCALGARWSDGACLLCSLQLVPRLWEHAAFGPVWTLSTDNRTGGKTNVPPTFLGQAQANDALQCSDCCMDPYKRACSHGRFLPHEPLGLSLRLRKANTRRCGCAGEPWEMGKICAVLSGASHPGQPSPWASAGHSAPACWGVPCRCPATGARVQLAAGALGSSPRLASRPRHCHHHHHHQGRKRIPPEELQPREELVEEDSSSPRERKSKLAPVDSSQPLGRPNLQVSFLSLSLTLFFPAISGPMRAESSCAFLPLFG